MANNVVHFEIGVDMPADDIPGVGRLAYIRDTEGNMLGMLKPIEGGAGM